MIENISSVKKLLETENEILRFHQDSCDRIYEEALAIRITDPSMPFPNTFDVDLDEVLEEASDRSDSLRRAIEYIDLAICALEEI